MTEEKALDIVEKVINKMYEKVRLLENENKELKLANKGLKKQLLIGRVNHCFFYDNELNHIRQWFNTTIDQNQDKDIEKTEWKLGLKIHKCLNITPENRIVKNCG